MIISTGRKYVFVHIPKTGGTSLTTALEARAMRDDILIGDTPKAKLRTNRLKSLTTPGRLWKPSTSADVAGLFDPSQMFTFTLTRNPWDRMVSYYTWLQAQTFDHAAVTLAQSNNFSDFLNNPQTVASIANNPYASYVPNDAHFFRVELLATDLQPLWDHLGFSLTIPHINASNRPRDWRPYYSDADAALIAKICATDIARGGYQFTPL